MVNIEELKFDEKGLIPAIVVDSVSKRVLTLAYMNAESLKISMEKGLTCFFSRSRQKLWLKGETSGNYQHIVSITADCDKDALVVVVEPDGPACHTGSFSCFEARSGRATSCTNSRCKASMRCSRAEKPRCPRALTRPISSKRGWIRF